MLNNKFIKKKILFSLKEESNSISILFEILIIIAIILPPSLNPCFLLGFLLIPAP